VSCDPSAYIRDCPTSLQTEIKLDAVSAFKDAVKVALGLKAGASAVPVIEKRYGLKKTPLRAGGVQWLCDMHVQKLTAKPLSVYQMFSTNKNKMGV